VSNDLQAPAEDYRPELLEIRRQLLAAGCQRAVLSGSGSTVLGFPGPGDADRICARWARPDVALQAGRLLGIARPAFADVQFI
jgi:4-diphosphocytidyl-2C-methyl-D-erythritol kinase